MGSKHTDQAPAYAYYMDNIKLILIFLVVFNHMIAFKLIDVNVAAEYICYSIYIFHMPAFIFVSGYFSRSRQDVEKNIRRLLMPYIVGYSLTWLSHWAIGSMREYEIFRPTGTVMWYLLALLIYRFIIEGLGQIRCIIPISILIALWAGTNNEFSTFFSLSRIVVFFPFFVGGYLWKEQYTEALRRLKGKWLLFLMAALLLFLLPNYMIQSGISAAIFRGNASYEVCGLSNEIGAAIRLLVYLISFIVILTLISVVPDKKFLITFAGKNTMSTYILHYPVLILMDGFGVLAMSQFLNLGVCVVVSLAMVFLMGSGPVTFVYNKLMEALERLVFKRPQPEEEEA